MRNRIIGILAFSFLVGLPGLAFADEPGEAEPIVISPYSATPAPAAQDDSWKFIHQRGRWLPQFEFTGRPGSQEIHGFSPDLMIPIAQNSRNLIFTSVIGNLFWDDGDDFQEINVGLGYRRLMGDSSWILGGYAYWDRIWSRFDNTFDEAALGIEALSWNWEARANGYIAPEDTQFVNATGISTATLVGTVPTLTMSPRIEQAMSGVDAEVGWRLPFFGDDGLLSDTRILAGGFWYAAPDLKDFAGPMVRFETRMWEIPFLPEESRLTLGTSYRWDKYRDHFVQGQIGVRIPLGRPDRAVALNKVERRMVDRPVRDFSVVTRRGSATSERVRTRTGVIIGDAYFFDYDTFGDGSFDDPMHPYEAEEGSGVIPVGPNDLLIGLANTGDIPLGSMDGEVYTQEGQTWMGGGTDLMVWGAESGQPAIFTAPGTAATFCCTGTALVLAGNNTVEGLHFEHMGTGLDYDDSSDTMFDIYNNHFRQMGTGVSLVSGGNMTAYVHDNWFERMGTGVYVYGVGAFDIMLEAYGNDFSNMGTGLYSYLNPYYTDEPSSFSLNVHDNSFAHMDQGIGTEVSFGDNVDYTHTSQIVSNTFFDVWDGEVMDGDTDYHLEIYGNGNDVDAAVDVDVDGNTSTNGQTFVSIYAEGIQNGVLNFDVTNNKAIDLEHGIFVGVDGGPEVNVNIAGNEIAGVFVDDGDGMLSPDAINVWVDGADGSPGTTITIADNLLELIEEDAIDVYVAGRADTTLTVSGNQISGVGDGSWGDRGIEIDFDDVGEEQVSIDISNNVVEHVDGSSAIGVNVEEGADTTINVADNVVGDVWRDGIRIWLSDNGSEDGNAITVTGNSTDQVGDDGIDVKLQDLYGEGEGDLSQQTTVTIAGNDVNRSDDNGIQVDLYSTDDAEVTIDDNLVRHSGDPDDGWEGEGDGNGIQVTIDSDDYSEDNTITISNNTIERTEGEHAIEIDMKGDAEYNEFIINANTIEIANQNGIDIWIESGSNDNSIDMNGNSIDVVETGIAIDNPNDETTYLNSDSDNVVDNYSDNDEEINGDYVGTLLVNGNEVPVP